MKNKEKYFDELMEILVSGYPLAVDKRTNKPVCCRWFDCEYCLVNDGEDGEKESCSKKAIREWLEAEYQEPIKLTDDEIVILKNVDKEYKWIARGKSGDLFFYKNEPEKDILMWKSFISYIRDGIFNHLFQFIKFDDEEPYNIDELLKQNGVER